MLAVGQLYAFGCAGTFLSRGRPALTTFLAFAVEDVIVLFGSNTHIQTVLPFLLLLPDDS